MASHQNPHVAVVPFPAPGHYIPLLEVSRLVASQGLTVSYVTTPANVPRLQDFVNDAVNCGIDLRLLILPTPPVEGLPEGKESADVCSPESQDSLLALVRKLQQPFDAWMEQQFEAKKLDAPVCIVFDSLMEWARQSAEQFKISCVEFSACPAFAVSGTHSAARSILQGKLEKHGEEEVVLSLDLPRPLRFKRSEINEDFWSADEMNHITRFILPMLQVVGKGVSSGLILNTFEELESEYLQHLRNLTGKPVWAMGPLLPMSYLNGAGNKVSTRGKMADIATDEMVEWLDSQKTGSVVYVSFGSVVNVSKEQLKALAVGLESSQQPFVWAIRVSDSEGSEKEAYVPQGFLERTKERGMVIWGWAPQLLILSHASVGAFLSHCGWNSTLESLSLGVPIVGWPMNADQFFNIKILTGFGAGIQVCEHLSGFPDERKVREVLREVLGDGKGKEMRMAAQKVRDMARKAVGDGESSNVHVEGFASNIRKLLEMRKEQSSLC